MSSNSNTHAIKFYRHNSISNPVHNEEIGQDIKIHRLMVEIQNIPLGLRTEGNAREAKLNKAFHKEMKSSIIDSENSDFTSGIFHLRNSGIVIVAQSAQVVDGNTLRVDFGNTGSIIDGGHTYKVICSVIEDYNNKIIDYIPEEYVQLEIITGLNKHLFSEISQARNTSQKHLAISFESQKGNFEWLKKALDGRPGLPDFSEKIAWYQNAGAEEGVSYPVDATDILKRLTACDIINYPILSTSIEMQQGKAHPTISYNNAEAIVSTYKDKKQDYVAMQDIVLDICRLYDFIIMQAPNWVKSDVRKIFYPQPNKKSEGKKNKPAPNAPAKNAKELIFLGGQSTKKTLISGFAYPMLGALRLLLEEVDTADGKKVNWKQGYNYPVIVEMLENGLGHDLTLAVYQALGGEVADTSSITNICRSADTWFKLYSAAKEFIENCKK